MTKFYVMRYNSNTRKIEMSNVIHEGWYDELKKLRRNKKIHTRQDVKEWLDKNFMYYYWSKSECEIMVGDLWDKNDELGKNRYVFSNKTQS